MTVAKNIEENIELSRTDELAKLKAKKSWTKPEMERILEIEKEIMAETFAKQSLEALDEQMRNNNSNKIISTKTLKKGHSAGIKIINH